MKKLIKIVGICILVLSIPLTANAEVVVSGDFMNMLTAPEWSELSLVYDTTTGELGYFESVSDAYMGTATLVKLPSEFDKDGSGLVTAEDAYTILNNPTNRVSELYNEILAKIGKSDYSGEEFRSAFYSVLYKHTGCGDCTSLGEMRFDVLLREIDYIVSAYCLVSGESFSSCGTNWFDVQVLSKADDTSCGLYSGILAPYFELTFCNNLDMANDFVLSSDDFESNWNEKIDPNGSEFVTPGSSDSDEQLGIDSSNAKGDWLEDNVDKPYTDEGVGLPDGSDLEDSDKQQIGDWLEQIKNSKDDKWFTTVRVTRIFVGIVLIIYSVLLYLAYWVDRMNNLIDISLLGILTLGRFAVSDDDAVSTYKSTDKATKLVVHRDVIKICCIGFAMGVLVLTGVLFKAVLKLVYWVKSL